MRRELTQVPNTGGDEACSYQSLVVDVVPFSLGCNRYKRVPMKSPLIETETTYESG